jgi:hypothetical protein
MEALQTLIERIVLTPNENAPDKLAIELHGDLATILNLASAAATPLGKSAGSADKQIPRSRSVPEGLLSVVAGAHNHLYRTRL